MSEYPNSTSHSSAPREFSFLKASLAGNETVAPPVLVATQATWVGPGMLRLEPESPRSLPAVVISVGVHGDEIVPIRLVDRWLNQCVAEGLPINRPMLILMANPLAVAESVRLIEHNMNRLFAAETHGQDDLEKQRASRLMAAVQEFVSTHPEGMHFDLHSTIKPSDRDRFALVPPACADRNLEPLMHWFRRMSVDAWVQNTSPAATFSNFSAQMGYLSATVEVGQVTGPDQPLDRFLPLVTELAALAAGDERPGDHDTREFQVLSEIVRPDDAFEVLLDDFVNFRPLTAGTVLARNNEREWTIEQDGDALLFLNANVPVGHRVALVVRPV